MKKLLMSVLPLAVLASCSQAPVEEQSSVVLADSCATTATKALFQKLKASSAQGYLVGHQDALAYGHDWYRDGESDFKQVCGDYPAVFGWELADLELGNELNIDSIAFSDMRRYMVQIADMGGVNSVSWHINNIITGGNCWDVTSKAVVTSILAEGEIHDKYESWLGIFADFVKSLKDSQGNDVPILFRPYHELSGSWFWWGRDLCTPSEYKQLWRYTFDYLVNAKGVHNLIYVYSMASFTTEEEFLERYPGDDVVDVLGFDSYQWGSASAEAKIDYIQKTQSQVAVARKVAADRNKMWALTEMGFESVPDSVWFTTVVDPILANQDAAYVLFWRNAFNKPEHFYVPYKGHAAAQDLQNFVAMPHVFTLNDFMD